MMMGLVAKNAILLVDRANENRTNPQVKYTLIEALVEAGTTRLRPILMTTLAMVIGMLPLALAKGAGAELNSGLAWVLIGGLSSSMFLTLLVVPVVYYGFTRLLEKVQNLKYNKVSIQAVLVILVCSTLSFQAKAQPKSLTLKDAETLALQQNKQLKAAEIEVIKAVLTTKETKGNLLPVLNLTGNFTRNIKTPVFFFPTFGADPATGALVIDDSKLSPVAGGARNAYNTILNFSMPLYNAEVYKAIDVAKNSEAVAKASIKLSQLQILDEVRKAYYNVLFAQSSTKLIEQSIERTKLNLSSVKGFYAQGLATDADTLNAFVNYQTIIVNKIKANNAVITSTNFLKYLLGLNSTDEILLLDKLDNLMAVDSTTSNERAELIINKTQVQQAKANLSFEKSKYLPNLSLVSQYNIQAQANDFKFNNYIWPNSWFVGLQLNVPIFNGFKTQNRIKAANESIKQLNMQQANLKEQISVEQKNAWLSVEETKQVYKATSLTIPAAERSLQFIKSRWQQGIAKYTEVADAELTFIQAKNNLLQAAYNYQLAVFNYLKSQGK
jgi:outer membrane protein TolC